MAFHWQLRMDTCFDEDSDCRSQGPGQGKSPMGLIERLEAAIHSSGRVTAYPEVIPTKYGSVPIGDNPTGTHKTRPSGVGNVPWPVFAS